LARLRRLLLGAALPAAAPRFFGFYCRFATWACLVHSALGKPAILFWFAMEGD